MKTRPVKSTNKVAQFEAACRAQGLPLTVQRRVILEALAARDDHPTADEIFAAIQERIPGVSRTTVYRVLETLVGVGVASKVCHPGATARFDAKTDRHHHLVCRECGKVRDLEAPALDRLPLPNTSRRGFEIRDYSIHFLGTCADCRPKRRRDDERSHR